MIELDVEIETPQSPGFVKVSKVKLRLDNAAMLKLSSAIEAAQQGVQRTGGTCQCLISGEYDPLDDGICLICGKPRR